MNREGDEVKVYISSDESLSINGEKKVTDDSNN